ncbi:MAG: hypothetical protein HY582_05030 [Candidatus Omnitrophica bacterium]|nr:hypothetical protein [Candidatus Omnitrophota bacterium]
MKPELQYSILCDDVRQEKNGKFIFVGAFNLIAAQKFPTVHPVFYMANRWCSGEGEFREMSRIVNEESQIVAASPEVSFQLKGFFDSHFVISRFQGVRFAQPGKYAVEVVLGGELFRRFPFQVVQIQKEPAS